MQRDKKPGSQMPRDQAASKKSDADSDSHKKRTRVFELVRVAVACMHLAASRKLVGDLRNLRAFRLDERCRSCR